MNTYRMNNLPYFRRFGLVRLWVLWMLLLPVGLAGDALGNEDRPAPEDSAWPVYTLEASLDIGLRQAAAMVNAARDEEIALARVHQVRAQVLPHLRVHGSYLRLDEVDTLEFEGRDVPLGNEDNYAASVELSQLLYAGGSVRAALTAARTYKDIASAQTEEIRAGLTRQIVNRFYGILVARETVEVARESLGHLDELVKEAARRHETGAGSEYEWMAARVRYANALPVAINAEQQLELARLDFMNLLQLPGPEFIVEGELTYRPVSVALEAFESIGLTSRPALRQAEQQVHLMRASLRNEQAAYYPVIRANATYAARNPGSFGATGGEWDAGWEAGLTLEWAFLDGGLRRSAVREAVLEQAKAEELRDELRRQILLDIRRAYLELERASKIAEAGLANVELAQRGLDIVKVRFERGLAGQLEFSDGNLALSEARLNRLQALRDYLAALEDLRVACGLSRDAFDDLTGRSESRWE